MPDGTRIPGDLSQVWKKRIDDHYRERAAQMMYVFHGVEDDEDEVEEAESNIQRELVALQAKLSRLEKGF